MKTPVWIYVMTTLVALTQAEIRCEKSHQKVGCYDVRRGMALVLKENDVDILDSENIKTNIHSLICNCQDRALRLGFRYFAIGVYSECWIGNRITRYPSTSSGTCVNVEGQTCARDDGKECVGIANSEYVYRIVRPGMMRRGQKLQTTMESITIAADEIKETPLPLTIETSLDDIVVTTTAPVSNTSTSEVSSTVQSATALPQPTTAPSQPTTAPPQSTTAPSQSKTAPAPSTTSTATSGSNVNKSFCQKDFYKIGCYSPQYYMSKMLTLRWKSPDVQRYMKWKYGIENFEEIGLEDLVCRCMNKTKEYGYNYFAIRDSDSCYIGDYVFRQLDDRVPSTLCETKVFNETCSDDDDKLCHGGAPNSVYMYKLGKRPPTSSPAPPADNADPNPVCERSWKKAGCWRRQSSMRLIFSDNKLNYRYYERRGGVGKKFKWEKVELGLQGLVCRCNQAAKFLNGTFFAVTRNEDCFVGEAFRSFSEVVRLDSCVDAKKGDCSDNDENECSGKTTESYVYAMDGNWTLPQWIKLKEQIR